MLSPAQVAAFREDGYLVPLPALGAAEIVKYRTGVESYIAARSGDTPATMKSLRTKAHLCCPPLLELARTPLIVDQVADILGIFCRSREISPRPVDAAALQFVTLDAAEPSHLWRPYSACSSSLPRLV